MIERTNAFKVGDRSFLTLEDAQKYEIQQLFAAKVQDQPLESDGVREAFSKWILENREAILDILTTTKSSKPKARKIHGGTKVRKATISFQPPAQQ